MLYLELQQHHIAILFFSRSARSEAKVKPLSQNDDVISNYRISKTLVNYNLNALNKSGLDVQHFDESLQTGDTFGQRISNAFSALFRQGYSSVICVGNDIPDLEKTNWDDIIADLQNNKSVLGPDCRNGAYLIALNKSQFDFAEFSNLPWKKSGLFEALKNYCLQYSKCSILDRKHDINNFRDLLKFLDFSPNNAVIRILKDSLKIIPLFFSNAEVRLFSILLKCLSRFRAPPIPSF